MHELAITRNIVEICEQHAAGRKVSAVILQIGELSGVVPEAVEFCFEACTRETLLEGAALEIERVPGRARCACGIYFSLDAWYAPCPACGGNSAELLAGDELRVKELEVE